MFGKRKWLAFEAVSKCGWGATLRMVVLMASTFVFSGSLLGLIVLLTEHHAAWLLVCHHSPDTVRRWLGNQCASGARP